MLGGLIKCVVKFSELICNTVGYYVFQTEALDKLLISLLVFYNY